MLHVYLFKNRVHTMLFIQKNMLRFDLGLDVVQESNGIDIVKDGASVTNAHFLLARVRGIFDGKVEF